MCLPDLCTLSSRAPIVCPQIVKEGQSADVGWMVYRMIVTEVNTELSGVLGRPSPPRGQRTLFVSSAVLSSCDRAFVPPFEQEPGDPV